MTIRDIARDQQRIIDQQAAEIANLQTLVEQKNRHLRQQHSENLRKAEDLAAQQAIKIRMLTERNTYLLAHGKAQVAVRGQSVYCVTLPTTNASKDTACVFDKATGKDAYIPVENSILYVVAPSMAEVAATYPAATEVTRVGVAG